jgi:protein-disulfide isomerase
VLLIAAVAAVAVAAAASLVALGAATRDGASIPERVATGEGRVLGSPDAPVTIVEYADFQCPVCKRAVSSVLARIEEEYVLDGRVNIEFRMFPFLGQESWDAAQAAESARDQGKFWEFHDALFNAQGRENGGAFAYDRLVQLARDIGLDVALFEETLRANVHLDAVQAEIDAARAAGVSSTPTFFVGDTKIVGLQPYEIFQDAIETALAEAGR